MKNLVFRALQQLDSEVKTFQSSVSVDLSSVSIDLSKIKNIIIEKCNKSMVESTEKGEVDTDNRDVIKGRMTINAQQHWLHLSP